MTTQKIEELTVSQYRGIAGTATIRPDGPGVIVLGGPNSAGKTSFLKGIEEVFIPGGIKGTPQPLNDGRITGEPATEAYLEVVTDAARLRKTFRDGKPTKFEAFNLDGKKHTLTGPQWVAQATGGQVFNTRQFITLDDKAQRQALLKRIDLPFDLDEMDAAIDATFKERTAVNGGVKRLEGQLAGCDQADPTLPSEEQSAAEIARQLEQVNAHNARQMPLYNAAVAANDANEAAVATVERLMRELEEAQKAAQVALEQAVAAHTAYTEFVPLDPTPLRAQLEGVDDLNRRIRGQAQRAQVAAALAAEKAQADALTAKLTAFEEQKKAALKAAVFPVDGLGIDDTGITFDGQPFKTQVNAAKQIAVSLELATSATPNLRLVFIEDGDMLDDESLAEVQRVAEERGFYVLMERGRDNSSEIGVTFHAGAIAE